VADGYGQGLAWLNIRTCVFSLFIHLGFPEPFFILGTARDLILGIVDLFINKVFKFMEQVMEIRPFGAFPQKLFILDYEIHPSTCTQALKFIQTRQLNHNSLLELRIVILFKRRGDLILQRFPTNAQPILIIDITKVN
jgi:hypothetical protein